MPKIDPANTIAFMGVAGANADIACRRNYPYMQTLPCASFEEVFETVMAQKAQLGMVPLDNSNAGRVAETHQLLPKLDLHIIAEHYQHIEHYLVAPPGATLDTVKEVYSHPQALMQCRNHLRRLGLVPKNYSNTATAAADVAKWNDPCKAAISSLLAAELYGLQCIKEHVEDASDNITVFAVFAREPLEIEEERKHILTTLLFTVRNIPAALYKSLGGFATNNINIVKLESYIPGGVSVSAQFFLTFEGNPKEKRVQLALEELGFFCDNVKIMGIYPADTERYTIAG